MSSNNEVVAYLSGVQKKHQTGMNLLHELFRKNIPAGYEEVIRWGAVTYEVPLSFYPDTYNKQPLMYAAFSSKKNHMAVYLNMIYADEKRKTEFVEKWKSTGKKLDMGASCVRFKKEEDLNWDIVAAALSSVSMKDYVAAEQAFRASKKK